MWFVQFLPQGIQKLSKYHRTKQGKRTVFVHQYKHWYKCFSQFTSLSADTSDSKKKYQKPKGNQKCSQSNQRKQSLQPSKKRHPPWKDNKGKQNFKSKGDCTWCGDFKHKDNFRGPVSRHKYKICSKVGHFPKMCFFKDMKQQHIQLVQAHGEEAVTPQMSDESFHDANEEYMPSDDDFVHNYMVHVHKTSLQQKPAKSSKFQQIKHFVKVRL